MKTKRPPIPTLRSSVPVFKAGLPPPARVRNTQRDAGRIRQRNSDRIMTRDKGLCQCARCRAAGSLKLASEVDHVLPLWAGGKEADSNRAAINRDCHAAKTKAETRMRARGYTPADPDEWLQWVEA
ncbi:hypothetical protein BurJ1DRAFT_2549 [Burkholderiales bacterium JOSHI_001]|nr:hypothetical protein BurJ1DRAFT_2549 [Burkholderiales bacterium JOSHI_001]